MLLRYSSINENLGKESGGDAITMLAFQEIGSGTDLIIKMVSKVTLVSKNGKILVFKNINLEWLRYNSQNSKNVS